MNEYVTVYNHKISIFQRTVTGGSTQNPTNYTYFIGRTTVNPPESDSASGTAATAGRRTKEFSGKTKEEVLAKAYNFFRQSASNTDISANPIKASEWIDICFERFYRHCEETTRKAYLRSCKELKEDLGDTLLQVLSPERLQNTIDNITEKGIAPVNVHKDYSFLNRCMKLAVSEGRLAVNPAESLVLPPKVINHNPIMTTKDIEAFIRECVKDQYGNLYLTILFCALRRGEGMGLCDGELHRDQGYITIYQQYRGETESIEKTKTRKNRTIYPPKIAFYIIEKQIEIRDKMKSDRGEENWEDTGDLIFTKPDGSPLSEKYVNKRYKQIVAKIGRPELHMHDLRRSSASVALYLSNNPKAVQNLLGHSSLGMTYYYCDSTVEQMTDFSEAQNKYYTDLFRKAKEDPPV